MEQIMKTLDKQTAEILAKYFRAYSDLGEEVLREMKLCTPYEAAATILLAELTLPGEIGERVSQASLVCDVLAITEPSWEDLGL